MKASYKTVTAKMKIVNLEKTEAKWKRQVYKEPDHKLFAVYGASREYGKPIPGGNCESGHYVQME